MTIRVLLADDHAMMRDGLKALLSASPDISVIAEVSNGREAVRRAEELRPDVVVMDVAMPELNGIEAARMLRDRCPETRIVILSMHSSSEHVFRAFEAGAAGYPGGFVEHYLVPLLYPASLTRTVQLLLGATVLVVNVIARLIISRSNVQ